MYSHLLIISPLYRERNLVYISVNDKMGKNKSNNNVYQVEKVLNKRINNDKIEYYLKWQGFQE